MRGILTCWSDGCRKASHRYVLCHPFHTTNTHRGTYINKIRRKLYFRMIHGNGTLTDANVPDGGRDGNDCVGEDDGISHVQQLISQNVNLKLT